MHLSPTIAQPAVNLEQTAHTLSRLPLLEDLFEVWFTVGLGEAAPALEHREQVLGAATLSYASIRLLYEIASEQISDLQVLEHISAWGKRPLHERVVRHVATYSAAHTQAVLPADVLVQKTVSLEMAGKLLLCTCVGDVFLQREQRRALAHALALPPRAAKQSTFNPATCDPVEQFEMLPGMVSPFLRPLRKTSLTALVLIPWPNEWEEQEQEVAVSLSLWESLLLPLRCLRNILLRYADQAFPSVRIVAFPAEE